VDGVRLLGGVEVTTRFDVSEIRKVQVHRCCVVNDEGRGNKRIGGMQRSGDCV